MQRQGPPHSAALVQSHVAAPFRSCLKNPTAPSSSTAPTRQLAIATATQPHVVENVSAITFNPTRPRPKDRRREKKKRKNRGDEANDESDEEENGERETDSSRSRYADSPYPKGQLLVESDAEDQPSVSPPASSPSKRLCRSQQGGSPSFSGMDGASSSRSAPSGSKKVSCNANEDFLRRLHGGSSAGAPGDSSESDSEEDIEPDPGPRVKPKPSQPPSSSVRFTLMYILSEGKFPFVGVKNVSPQCDSDHVEPIAGWRVGTLTGGFTFPPNHPGLSINSVCWLMPPNASTAREQPMAKNGSDQMVAFDTHQLSWSPFGDMASLVDPDGSPVNTVEVLTEEVFEQVAACDPARGARAVVKTLDEFGIDELFSQLRQEMQKEQTTVDDSGSSTVRRFASLKLALAHAVGFHAAIYQACFRIYHAVAGMKVLLITEHKLEEIRATNVLKRWLDDSKVTTTFNPDVLSKLIKVITVWWKVFRDVKWWQSTLGAVSPAKWKNVSSIRLNILCQMKRQEQSSSRELTDPERARALTDHMFAPSMSRGAYLARLREENLLPPKSPDVAVYKALLQHVLDRTEESSQETQRSWTTILREVSLLSSDELCIGKSLINLHLQSSLVLEALKTAKLHGLHFGSIAKHIITRVITVIFAVKRDRATPLLTLPSKLLTQAHLQDVVNSMRTLERERSKTADAGPLPVRCGRWCHITVHITVSGSTATFLRTQGAANDDTEHEACTILCGGQLYLVGASSSPYSVLHSGSTVSGLLYKLDCSSEQIFKSSDRELAVSEISATPPSPPSPPSAAAAMDLDDGASVTAPMSSTAAAAAAAAQPVLETSGAAPPAVRSMPSDAASPAQEPEDLSLGALEIAEDKGELDNELPLQPAQTSSAVPMDESSNSAPAGAPDHDEYSLGTIDAEVDGMNHPKPVSAARRATPLRCSGSGVWDEQTELSDAELSNRMSNHAASSIGRNPMEGIPRCDLIVRKADHHPLGKPMPAALSAAAAAAPPSAAAAAAPPSESAPGAEVHDLVFQWNHGLPVAEFDPFDPQFRERLYGNPRYAAVVVELLPAYATREREHTDQEFFQAKHHMVHFQSAAPLSMPFVADHGNDDRGQLEAFIKKHRSFLELSPQKQQRSFFDVFLCQDWAKLKREAYDKERDRAAALRNKRLFLCIQDAAEQSNSSQASPPPPDLPSPRRAQAEVQKNIHPATCEKVPYASGMSVATLSPSGRTQWEERRREYHKQLDVALLQQKLFQSMVLQVGDPSIVDLLKLNITRIEREISGLKARSQLFDERTDLSLSLEAPAELRHQSSYAQHEASLAVLQDVDCSNDSFAYPLYYIKEWFRGFFPLHWEDLFSDFVHKQFSGNTVWIIIHPDDRPKVEGMMCKLMCTWLSAKKSGDRPLRLHHSVLTEQDRKDLSMLLFHAKAALPSLDLLVAHGIHFQRLVLKENQVLYGLGGCGHMGVNQSVYAEAIATNILHEDWLIHQCEASVRPFFERVARLAALEDKLLHKRVSQKDDSVPTFQQAIEDVLLLSSSGSDDADKSQLKTNMVSALNHVPMKQTCGLLTKILADLDERTPKQQQRYRILYADECQRAKVKAMLRALLALMHDPSTHTFLRTHYKGKHAHCCESCKHSKSSQQ